MKPVGHGFHGDGFLLVGDDPVELCQWKLFAERCVYQVHSGQKCADFCDGSALAENPRDEFKLCNVVKPWLYVCIGGVSADGKKL